ncbi:MAG: diaminopimelate decarboxylase [Candidatus Cloacimonetes bacterium]|nr:diaminopimelate decarboxylase [Candidatus Cloacimonadota bacterium]
MAKKEYIKPFIKKQTTGMMNKFGRSYHKSYRDEIEGVKINAITEKFGSPVFVFSEKEIRKTYRDIYREFSSRYPKIQFSWSYKTNYLDAICGIYKQEGLIAEVVSEFEYEKARNIGYRGDQIIYNGPFKPEKALKIAFEENAIVNLDNFDEIFKAEKVAEKLGKKVDVGIRLNMDTGIYPQWNRFGFNLENKSAYNAVKRIFKSEWLNLKGLHSHIGTFMLEPKAYAVQVKKTIELMRILDKEFNIQLDYLDFGGGFPSRNKLKGTYLPPEIAVPPIKDYVEAISNTLLSELTPDEYPLVYLETGRALIDEAGFLITTVDAVKRLPDGTKSYIIDAGVNFLYTSTWYNYKVEIDRQVQGAFENSVVYGPLCMNIDVVLENVSLPPLNRGTKLILSPMGAYNVTQWMQFIRYRPAVCLIMEDGSLELIRREENLQDVITPEIVPEKLKKK